MDTLFYIGVAFLPFEDFFFAPSTGWAAISPLIFFVYALTQRDAFNAAFKRYFGVVALILVCLALSFFDYLFVSLDVGNLIDTLGTVVLGVTALFSFDIYLNQRAGSMDRVMKIVLVSYGIALGIGVVEWAASAFGIGGLVSLFDAIMKRCYLPSRIQFMFTEPSFTGMHLYGVLLPLHFVTKDKRVLWLIAGFVLVGVGSGSSLRLIVDSIAVVGLYLLNSADWRRVRTYAMAIVAPVLMALLVLAAMQLSPRFASIVNGGLQNDASGASREFRIEAVVYGALAHPERLLTGYGAGNAWAAIQDGYDEALANYTNAYTGEVVALGNPDNHPNSMFCGYARILAEYGIVVLLVIVGAFAAMVRRVPDKNWRFLLLVAAYLYLQFDGYGFYTIWLLLALRPLFGYQEIAWGGSSGKHSSRRFSDGRSSSFRAGRR